MTMPEPRCSVCGEFIVKREIGWLHAERTNHGYDHYAHV